MILNAYLLLGLWFGNYKIEEFITFIEGLLSINLRLHSIKKNEDVFLLPKYGGRLQLTLLKHRQNYGTSYKPKRNNVIGSDKL